MHKIVLPKKLFNFINVEKLKENFEIIVDWKPHNRFWGLGYGQKKAKMDAYTETGFFSTSMHIDRRGLFFNSSLNDHWDIIKDYSDSSDNKHVLLGMKNNSKYQQVLDTVSWSGVVLALQIPRDKSILSVGSEKDYYKFINNACSFYKDKLFMKLHPLNTKIESKFYQKIAEENNCRIGNVNNSILNDCKFVILYNSTYAIDCFLRDVPVVQYAPGYWSCLPVCSQRTQEFLCPNFIHFSDYSKNQNKLINFLVEKYCFNFTMDTDKWVKLLNLYIESDDPFPLTEDLAYINNLPENA